MALINYIKFLLLKIIILLIRIAFGKDYIYRLCKYKQPYLALKIVAIQIVKEQNNYSEGPSIIIAGVARTGKSILAKTIAHERNFQIINLDRFRFIWNNYSSDRFQRVKLKKHFLNELVSSHKNGLIIEGDELITDDMPNLCIQPVTHKLTFDYLNEIGSKNNTFVFLVGSSNATVEDKISGMFDSAKKNGCWAVDNMDMRSIFELSKIVISMSKEVSSKAVEYQFNYLDISPTNFMSDINEINSKIEKIINYNE